PRGDAPGEAPEEVDRGGLQSDDPEPPPAPVLHPRHRAPIAIAGDDRAARGREDRRRALTENGPQPSSVARPDVPHREAVAVGQREADRPRREALFGGWRIGE